MAKQMFAIFCFLSIFRLCDGLPLADFYPYGRNHGDQRVPTNDDGSSPEITISTLFPYFNQQFRSLYVNTNGAISFSETLSTFTPSAFPLSGNKKIVAPFWCDIDTRNGGDIWFYETNNVEILSRATSDVRKVFSDQINFEAAWAFVATWVNVAFYGANSAGKEKRNTFQCILITNGRHSFTIFLYNKIQWTTGTASGGSDSTGLGGTPAQVGFDAGDGFNFKAINESRTDKVINVASLSNIDIPGKFVYRIDTETVKEGGCNTEGGGTLTIFPRYGTMLGGTELSIGGPCMTVKDKITVKFEDLSEEIPCSMNSKVSAKCVTPLVYQTGNSNITLVIKHENGNSSLFSGIYTFVNPATIKHSIIRVNPLSWKAGQPVTIRWSRLPFHADSLKVDQFQILMENSREVVKKEKDIAEKVNASSGEYSFNFFITSTAAVIRIQPNLETTLTQNDGGDLPSVLSDSSRVLPAVWSDVFVVKPSTKEILEHECNSWELFETTMPQISREQIATCPCTIAQARLDISRFNPDPYCNIIPASPDDNYRDLNCIYQKDAYQCVRMAFASNLGYDNDCCYGKDGSLIITNARLFGGTALRYHYKGGTDRNVPYLSNILQDIVPYMHCCQYPPEYQEYGYCEKFLQRRPTSSCEGYIPPRPASTVGDPHLVTLDGLAYTFNGVGEFIFLQSLDRNLTVQARMEQYKDSSGNLKPASVITSLALQCDNDYDTVEVRLNSIRLCDQLLNGEQLDFEDRNSIEVKGSTILHSKTNSSVGDVVWTLVSCKTKNVAFNITCMAQMINVNAVVADKNLRGHLEGLLGNYNGRMDDDFTTAVGQIVPKNSSLEDIHNIFGVSWRTRSSESLFTYPVGKSHASYQNLNFRPVFIVLDNCLANVNSTCGDDKSCQFDYCTTGNEVFAASTRVFSEEAQQLVQVAIPGCGEPDKIPNGYWTFTGTSANLTCASNYKLSAGPIQIDCLDNGQWTTVNTTCELIQCGVPDKITNGYWILTGNSANLACASNYKLSAGPTQIDCLDNGQWTTINTKCELIPTPVTESRYDKQLWIKIGVPVAVFILIVIIVVLGIVVMRYHRNRIDEKNKTI